MVIKVKDDVFLSVTQAYLDKKKSECSQQESNPMTFRLVPWMSIPVPLTEKHHLLL